MTSAFLDFSKSRGNDLSTPVPEFGFAGLKPGDRWCLCAPRWQEAFQANQALRVVVRATHEGALTHCGLADLRRFAVDLAWQTIGFFVAAFSRYVGIDYSGAQTSVASLKGLRIYRAKGDEEPVEVLPPPSARKYWTRRGIAEWIIRTLAEESATIIGIDHCFSFPTRYFEAHGLLPDWPSFLEDFQRHWPTDGPHCYVDFVRDGIMGNGAARMGNNRWRRLTDVRAGGAKSVFHFDVRG
jgi:hypothetical protein